MQFINLFVKDNTPHKDKLRHRRSLWGNLALTLLLISACASPVIKGTDIPNTPKNREIVEFVEKYRQTIEAKDWRTLLSLVSPRYHEKSLSSESKDDYGYNELKTHLTSQEFKQLHFIRLSLAIEKIEYKEREEVWVYLRSKYSFRYPRGDYRPGWDTGIIDQLMILEYTGNQWRIVKGL